MKKIIAATFAVASMASCTAQDIALPKPDLQQPTMTVAEALATRHSVREYSDRQLTEQELSNVCWAACGVSWADDHRTAPTALNKREIRLFVFTADNVYEYMAEQNSLRHITKGDHRNLVAGGNEFSQDFVLTAPISLVMVIDGDLFGSTNERAIMMGCVDAGNVSENINLYCQAAGMVTVPRATMDIPAIQKLLGLNEHQLPIMNNPVGFPKQ